MLDNLSVRPKISFPFLRLNDLLEDRARSSPDSPVFLAPGRSPLSYGRLYRHIGEIGLALRAMGIGPQDRLAVLLPNGAELTVAIVCLAANAACAVINPAYAFEELDRYFQDLRPRALITQPQTNSPACRAAIAQGVPVIELVGSSNEAGLFTLEATSPAEPSPMPPGPGNVALLLLTSGTTSRPKIVPLTHANICTSAYSSVAAIGLKETDCCLNVLPLFHGHGLIATIMTSLAAGASVVCTPGYDATSFFGWLKEFQATWYSAVPTMHQAILAQARSNPAQSEGCRLRLIRSASAPLPPRVFADLEETFATTVIEFYGMTETASAPIACNPLPPRRRKPGSVGIPVGLEVAIMSDGGTILPRKQTGEVVVRGPSVMPGYDGDPAATEAAFTGDRFKTGDRGFFDDDGYLFLVGRTREMINRGGENIAPREVDEVLLEHPAVAEAATFAIPHATLGEDIAAAIVLRPHAKASVKDIRQFAMKRLAEFKVPRQLIMLDELPKGPTGKVQRVGLAAKLGLSGGAAAREAFAAPRTPLENVLAGIWADVLQRERVGIHDDFFALGGDSLLATHVLTCIDEAMKLKVDVAGLFDAPTVAEMAEHLEVLIQKGQARAPSSQIARASRDGALPASPPQERLWELQRALPEFPFFNVLYPLRITSPLDVAALEHALNEVVRRHEILRTTFATVEGRLVEVIAPELTVPLPVDDLSKLSGKRKGQAGHRLISGELLDTFDLERGPLIRARLLRFDETEHLFLIALHQTVVDGWSLGVLADEVATLYEAFANGRPPPSLPQALQYADFAVWQQQWRSHPELVAQLSYWRDQLRDPLPPLNLARSRTKRSADDLRTESEDFELPAKLAAAARTFGQSEGATLFMVLVAALQILMRRHLDQTDLRVATNVANRNRTGTEWLIGPLANTVILRTELGCDPTPRDVLRRVRATTLAAYANQDLPFEELAEVLQDERGLEPAGLCQVMILLHNAALRPVAASGKSLVFEEADPAMPMPLVTTTAYEVIIVLHEDERGLKGSCVYKPHLFSAGFIDRFLRQYRKVLEQIVARPDRTISSLAIAVPRKGK